MASQLTGFLGFYHLSEGKSIKRSIVKIVVKRKSLHSTSVLWTLHSNYYVETKLHSWSGCLILPIPHVFMASKMTTFYRIWVYDIINDHALGRAWSIYNLWSTSVTKVGVPHAHWTFINDKLQVSVQINEVLLYNKK